MVNALDVDVCARTRLAGSRLNTVHLVPVRPEPVEGSVHQTLRQAQGERGIFGRRTVLHLTPNLLAAE